MAHYLISEARIDENCMAMKAAMGHVPFLPAYSVKTNHVPHIVRRFYRNGFKAEVVSDMEVDIAEAAGVPLRDMVYNGPAKGPRANDVLENGGVVVFDSMGDMDRVSRAGRCMLRIAANIDNGVDTRFGTRPEDARDVLVEASRRGMDVVGIHCHVTKGRSREMWRQKIGVMADVYEDVSDLLTEKVVDFGGNMYSPLPEAMRDEFPECETYEGYGELFADEWGRFDGATLALECGTSVVSDVIEYETEVIGVKRTERNTFVLLDATNYALGWCSKAMNHPVEVIGRGGKRERVRDAKFVGRLCTEDDVFHRGYGGEIGTGDVVRFGNVGSYTISVKPPFIMPQDEILYERADGSTYVAKRKETAKDVLSTYELGDIDGDY